MATKSLMVVISGPDATAGSTFILWKNSGTKVPMKLDIIMDTKREIPTQPEIIKACNKA